MTWESWGWEGENRSLGIALPTANFGGLDTWISLYCHLNRHVLLLNDMRPEVTTEDFSPEELSPCHSGKAGSAWNNSTASAEEHWYLLHQALYLALSILDVIHSLHGTIVPILQKRKLTLRKGKYFVQHTRVRLLGQHRTQQLWHQPAALPPPSQKKGPGDGFLAKFSPTHPGEGVILNNQIHKCSVQL